LKPAFT